MTYDRARHQELTDILNNGLARVAGPQFVDDFTDTSDVAFASMLDAVLDVIKDRLTNGRNSAVVDLLVTPANILMAGRLVEALEDRGFYCSDMRRKSEELQADYLTFEAILMPLKPEVPAPAVAVAVEDVGVADVLEAQAELDRACIDLPIGGFCSLVSPDVTPCDDTTNFIAPGTVVSVFSQGMFAEKTQRVVAALKEAGYEVRHVAVPMAHNYPAFQVCHRYGAPEAARILYILRGLTNETIRTTRLSEDFAALGDYRVYLGND